MSRRPSHILRSDFSQQVTRILQPARLLLVGSIARELAENWRGAHAAKSAFHSLAELEGVAPPPAIAPNDLVIWFYSPENDAAETPDVLRMLTRFADRILLLPAPGADVARRRPGLVMKFVEIGFWPAYESNAPEVEAGGVLLQRGGSVREAEEHLPAVEQGFARVNAQLHGLRRILRTRVSELEAADQHIARLEEKVLQLKKAKRDLKELKAEKQALRKSPERKIGQVLLAPYRLPQKLVREVRKKFPKPAPDPRAPASPNEYQRWLERHRPSPETLRQMRALAQNFSPRPLISIITPVHNTPVRWLEEAVDSVRAQAYEEWELMLIDDASSDKATLRALEQIGASDPRIHVLRLENNCGISVASNRGIEAAKGDWIGLLDHDDLLEPDALYQTALLLQEHPDADLIYSDEDKLTENGFEAPFLKPDWSPDFFLSYNYVCHFTTMRRALVRQVGGFRSQFDFAQDYDLYLRIVSRSPRIYHIPRILYHWRRSAGSTSVNIRAKPHALEAARGAIASHLERAGEPGHVAVDWHTHGFRVRRELRDEKKIAIIIPTRDRIDLLARCIASIEEKSTYHRYEIVIVDNDSSTPEAHAYLRETPHRVLRYSGPFNFSALNNFAVEQTDAPWILFLNNDAEVINREWLTVMAEHVQRPEVGAVGARLVFRDETIQHAGIVLGVRGLAKHAFCGFPAESPGVCRQLLVTRNYSAVTAACLLTRREVFQEVGGFDEERLPVIFNDVDLCLKMRAAGYLIVYTPFAKLYHDESATRRQSVEPIETAVLQERWPAFVTRDPYYNPNLSREQADFSLGEPLPALP